MKIERSSSAGFHSHEENLFYLFMLQSILLDLYIWIGSNLIVSFEEIINKDLNQLFDRVYELS